MGSRKTYLLIPLAGSSLQAVISREDRPLTEYRWRLNPRGYVSRSTRSMEFVREGMRSRTIFIHRLILGILDDLDLVVDHLNGDPLDNRRVNLEAVTTAENNRRLWTPPPHAPRRIVVAKAVPRNWPDPVAPF
jgi:hypothetical protein